MDNLFLLLFFASFVCLIIGLIKPTVFSRFIKGEITRKKIGLIFGIVTVAFFVVFGVISSKSILTTKPTITTDNQPITTTKTETPQAEKAKTEEPAPTPTTTKGFPSLTEETMDKNLVLSCEGGDEVVLWDKPTDAGGGATAKYRIPCGTPGWAFNKYYNEEFKITFYAINTNDARVKNAYGWITEDLITWRE